MGERSATHRLTLSNHQTMGYAALIHPTTSSKIHHGRAHAITTPKPATLRKAGQNLMRLTALVRG